MTTSMQQTATATLSTDAHPTHADDAGQPNGCPSWCNHHTTLEGAGVLHCRRAEGEWGGFDIEQGDETTDLAPVFLPPDYREMSLADARAYAVAILAACDQVEGPRDAVTRDPRRS